MIADDLTPKQEIEHRIQQFQTEMRRSGIDGALILQKTDLYYFSGTSQQAHLYIPGSGYPLLMARKSYERAKAESPIDRIVRLNSNRDIPELLNRNGYTLPVRLGMELDVLPANHYLTYQSIFKESTLEDVSHPIRLVRAVKSEYEINRIRCAAYLSDKLAGYAKQILKEGMTEIGAAGKLEAEARRLGHQGIVRMRLWGSELFYGHLMSGASAAVPSYLASPTGGAGVSTAISQGPGMNRIKRREPILFDYTFAYKGYVSDHTRIFCIGGLPDDLVKAHQRMLDIQSFVQKMAKPGVKTGDLYEAALQKVKEMGYSDWFMGVGDERIHFIGHGVGLELDEYPFLAKGQTLEIQKNMTIALEPKLIFPEKGVVGIENTHMATDDGLIPLASFEDQIIEL